MSTLSTSNSRNSCVSNRKDSLSYCPTKASIFLLMTNNNISIMRCKKFHRWNSQKNTQTSPDILNILPNNRSTPILRRLITGKKRKITTINPMCRRHPHQMIKNRKETSRDFLNKSHFILQPCSKIY
jgi:hypothetical protein